MKIEATASKELARFIQAQLIKPGILFPGSLTEQTMNELGGGTQKGVTNE